MNLTDVRNRLRAPFPAHLVSWRPVAFNKDHTRALLLAHLDARGVMDRLDAICPDGWSYEVEPLTDSAVKGRLTVLGVTREDIGEGDTLKGAASDAFKRAAVHFGIGRYLYDLPRQWADWDDSQRAPVREPELPEWARPDHERTAGGAHLVHAIEQLKYEMPADLDLQREVYKHLKAALCILPTSGGDDTPPPSKGKKPAASEEQSVLGDAPGADDEATLNNVGASALHRDLGRYLRGMKDAEVKQWVSNRLGRLISSFEQIRCSEVEALKRAARGHVIGVRKAS